MRRPSLFLEALLGGLTSLPLIALSYLGQQWAALPFIPFDLFDWLARVLPGQIITNIIDLMVRLITLLGLGPNGSHRKWPHPRWRDRLGRRSRHPTGGGTG
jgi:hypothetical protein